LDVFTAPVLDFDIGRVFADPGPRCVLVDLTRLEYFGSAGVAVLLQTYKRSRDLGVPLRVITGGNPLVTRPLQMMGLEQVLRLHSTRMDALT
jgi:anti-anti-sigma factor